MAGGSFGGSIKLTGESEYTRALKTITSNLTVMASEMKLVSANDTKIFKVTNDITEVVKAANKIGHPKISENFYDGFKEASALGLA